MRKLIVALFIVGLIGGGISWAQSTEPFSLFVKNLSTLTPLDGSELVAIVQATGTSKKITTSNLVTGQPLYTPRGTGAQPQNIGPTLNNILYANEYGAVCDGATDDHVAFQNMIEAAIAKSYARFRGSCALNTTPLVLDGGVDFGGLGFQANSFLIPTSGVNAITVITDDPVYLHDFTISYASPTSTDTAITVTDTVGAVNSQSQFYRLQIQAGIGIFFVQAQNWVVSGAVIQGIPANGFGIIVENTVTPDVCGCWIGGGTYIEGGGKAAIEWESAGGFHIDNVTFDGGGWSTAVVWINLASGVTTSDIWVTNSALEGASTTADCIRMTRQGATGTLMNVVMNGNEFGGCTNGINAPTDANGSWLTLVTANDNVGFLFGTGAAANTGMIFGNTVSGLSIVGNSFDNANGTASSKATVVGTQTSTNCVVGPNSKIGTFAASTLSSCTSYTPN